MDPEFKHKHAEWTEAFSGQDKNSVLQQITELTWTIARFRLVNEARLLGPDANRTPKPSWLLHGLLNECFFNSQMVAIRRITSDDDDAFTLMRVLIDVGRNVRLITRENLLSLDAYPMDTTEMRRKRDAFEEEKMRSSSGGFYLPPELDTDAVEHRQAEIDALCGVDRIRRTSADTIDARLLRTARKRLNEAQEEIRVWVNKFVAHAVTPGERSKSRNANNISITLGHLMRAHETICRVACFLDTYVLGRTGHCLIPYVTNPSEGLDKPLVSSSQLAEVNSKWDDFMKTAEEWSQTDVSWLK